MSKPTQIYQVVNSLVNQAMGGDLAVINNQGLVDLGNNVLSSTTNIENFLNVLVDRIAEKIISFRPYDSSLLRMRRSNHEWGLITQKISYKFGDFENDDSVTLTNGASVDMYKINKPEIIQKLFTQVSTFERNLTIQRDWLRQAFTGPAALERFIAGVFGQVENEFELAGERLDQDAINNFIAELDGTARTINLVSAYNTLNTTELTAETALYDKDFLTYAVRQIKLYSKLIKRMSDHYNDGSVPRHTPEKFQNLVVLSDFALALDDTLLASTFHDFYVKLDYYVDVPYLQSADSRMEINVNRASDGTAKNIKNIIGCLYDIEAVGSFIEREDTLTTPLNARGRYYNSWYNAQLNYFNDLSENFFVFTLN